ncbi:MAG: SDR family oxidoreductase [Desulfobacterales bacterium]|jgi:NAD(P)-dependent dehydrogenase (short-subunit alcohol dehydrogenase family)|nr:SDR family oxidoreductase [Desulfobacteraceae bacterium]MBT7085113.1 SDR family oxidoreductase [Desulfobacterales bacterium]MBT7697754.1 SDR family oxidoreductase [Desulfobacterales bacterium]
MSDNEKIRIFTGAVAIITGGASGIGRAFGEALSARGCEVILADLQMDLAEEVAEKIRASGGKATAAELDVVNYVAVKNLVQQTFERCGRLDYMFNNAGIVIFGEPGDFEISDWDKSIDINFRGVVHGVHAAYEIMHKQGFGHIVNTASLAGLLPWPMQIPYTATKHAVVGLTNTLRAEISGEGIRASVLCPGAIQTPILEDGGRYGRWIRSYPKEKLDAFMASARPLPVDIFANVALKQISRNKAMIIIPFRWKILWWMSRLSPGLGIIFSKLMFKGMRWKLGHQ